MGVILHLFLFVHIVPDIQQPTFCFTVISYNSLLWVILLYMASNLETIQKPCTFHVWRLPSAFQCCQRMYSVVVNESILHRCAIKLYNRQLCMSSLQRTIRLSAFSRNFIMTPTACVHTCTPLTTCTPVWPHHDSVFICEEPL